MNKYLVFAGEFCYPAEGGANNLVGSYKTMHEAERVVQTHNGNNEDWPWDWANILCTETGEITHYEIQKGGSFVEYQR